MLFVLIVFITIIQILNETYLAKQEMLRTELSSLEAPIHLAGDGRYNSMGHSAVYGLYTLMESESQKIIVSELVKASCKLLISISK